MTAKSILSNIRNSEFFDNKIIESIFAIALFVLILFLAGIKFYSVASFNVPHEFRETNMVAFAEWFATGKNPYSFLTLHEKIPVVTSQYGFFVPLLSAPFVKIGKILGFSPMQICQIITIIVELIGVLLAYLIILTNSRNRFRATAGALVTYSCYWRYAAFGGAFPDQYGVTLTLLLAFCVNKFEQKKSHKTVLYALICVILFYIKQYFVFSVVGLGVYLFFYSRKDFLKFVIYEIVFGVISAFVVTKIFPLYFPEAIAVTSGAFGNAGWGYSLNQIKTIGWNYYPLISIAYAVLVCILMIKIKSKPDMKCEVSPGYAAIQSVCILPIVVVLSLNIGTYWTYYLQLWWIYVILTVFEKLTKLQIKSFVTLFFVVITLLRAIPLVVEKPLNSEQKHNWEAAYKFLEYYSREGDILVAPHLSAYCLEHGIPTSDYGQAEFNSAGNLNHFLNHRVYPKIFPATEKILLKNIEYNKQVKENVKNKHYAIIALTDMGNYHLTESEIESCGYKKADEIVLVTGTQQWKTRFYIVDKSEN